MSHAPFSNEVALRIGLAAKVLPDVSIVDVIEALEQLCGESIDEAALGRITVTQLKAAFGQSFDVDGDEESEADRRSQDIAAYKEAVRFLWGEASEAERPPAPEPYEDGEMPDSIRIAIASNSQEELNGHFGSCQRYLVYQVSPDQIKLVGVRPTLEADLSSDKNQFRVNLIRDCKVLYVVSAGGPAAAKVIKADIHLISNPEGGQAREVAGKLQQVLRGVRPPWLAKLTGVAPGARVRNYRAEASE